MNPLAEMELEVPLRKLTDYLLSPTHPVGRHKARFFAALGFTAANPLDLAEALKLQARVSPEVQEEATPLGLKWAARGKLWGPWGGAGVVSVWVGEGCGGTEPCARGQIPVGTATRYARGQIPVGTATRYARGQIPVGTATRYAQARRVTAYPAEGGRG